MNITFNNFIGEKEDVIEKILNSKGLILCSGPTGGGKTFTYIKKFKELAAKDENRVFIILCPNRLQNQQNGKSYGINVIIGGTKAAENIKYASAVYEKIEEIMLAYLNKKITLIVDEAHELIESIDYRESALNDIDKASKIAFNTIHVTATPRKLEKYYKYNNKYYFNLKKRKNNLEKLKIIPSANVDATLCELLKINKDKNKKSLVFLSGPTDDLETLKSTLDRKGYRVGKITREDKKSDLYLNIVENSLILDEYDIILSTKVIECGTNINNTDIVPIEVIKNENHFNPDGTEQKFARLRNKNEEGYFIFKKQNEIEEIRSYESIKENSKYSLDLTLQALKLLRKAQQTSFFELSFGIDEALNMNKNAIFGTYLNDLIKFTKTESGEFEFEINKKRFINKVFREYDKQLLHNISSLKNELTHRIKSDAIEIIDDFKINDKSLKSELKENKREIKLKKEEQKKQAKNIILQIADTIYFQNYLSSKDRYALKNMIKNLNIDIYNDILFLEKQKTELLKIEKLHSIEKDITVLLNYYESYSTMSAINRFLKHYNYITFNKMLVVNLPPLYSSYAVLRNKFDPIKDRQGRVKQNDILNVVGELNDKKMLWQFDSQRIKNDYEASLVETDKAKRKKLIKRIYDKTINELKLIYILVDDGKGNFRISSLKKLMS